MFAFLKSLLHPGPTGVSSSVAVGTQTPSVDGYESGEEHFARDVETLDRDFPGWDEASRVDDALLRLTRGMSVERAVAVFGEATVRQACQQMAGASSELSKAEMVARAGYLTAGNSR